MLQIPKNEIVDKSKEKLENLKIWIYGQPGKGKTQGVATFPDVLFLNTDGNMKGVNRNGIQLSKRLPAIDKATGKPILNEDGTPKLLTKFQTVIYWINHLIKNKKEIKEQGYKTIAFDVVDMAMEWLLEDFLGTKQITTLDWQQYPEVKKILLEKIINPLVENFHTQDDFNIVFVSHEKLKELKGADHDMFIPSLFNGNEATVKDVAKTMDLIMRATTIQIPSKVEGESAKTAYAWIVESPQNKEWALNRFFIKSQYVPQNYESLKKAILEGGK